MSLQLLLDHGVEVNAADSEGCTALYFAINAHNVELAAAEMAELKVRAAPSTASLCTHHTLIIRIISHVEAAEGHAEDVQCTAQAWGEAGTT
jgi:hypothetical protein